ncbi:hypothetical protein GCM10023160_05840 [Brachybacterium paraconglomeratum]|uniref:hypothetical protein n=1 Tax=Brachybacterium paraconglomeratum TaxID=173362 RepID=UPI0031EBA981
MKGNLMYNTTTQHIGRRTFSLAALGALALSACGSGQRADFEETGGSDASDGGGSAGSDAGGATAPDATADLPRLEAGFTVEEFTKDVTVASTLQPKNSTVITPTGVLSIDRLQEIATVSAESVGLEAEMGEDGEALDLAPADGEVLRAVELSFTPFNGGEAALDEASPLTDISISMGGSQTHLAEIDGEYSTRNLISVPKDGSASLVVSSEGHDQMVDLLTGERQADEVAAAYYRSDRVQEPHHTFPLSVDPFPVLYSDDADSEVTTTTSFQAATLGLTAWTETTGWADPGSAWLVMEWSSAITISTEIPGLVRATDYSAAASVTVDGETTTDEIHEDKLNLNSSNKSGERTLVVAVPVDVSSATVSMSGGFSLQIDPGVYEIEGSLDRTFESEDLTVDFPGTGSTPSAAPSDGGGS